MGLAAFLVTILLMLLGAGYYLIGSPSSVLTVENSETSDGKRLGSGSGDEDAAGSLPIGTGALERAKEIKTMAEERAAETMEADENQEPGTRNLPSLSLEDSTAPLGQGSGQLNITNRSVSFGFEKTSGRMIDTIVLHSSYNNQGGDKYSVERVIDIWKSYEVAPHYMIDRKGNIYRLVEDANIAWHAGVSEMPDGRTDVNKFSVGVEILNGEDDRLTDAQYRSVNDLIAYLKTTNDIKYVVGHADIAPGRKTDPWNFDWKRVKR